MKKSITGQKGSSRDARRQDERSRVHHEHPQVQHKRPQVQHERPAHNDRPAHHKRAKPARDFPAIGEDDQGQKNKDEDIDLDFHNGSAGAFDATEGGRDEE